MTRLLAALALLAAAGCTKREAEPQAGPPVMSKAERERGVTLCTKYLERVCACPGKADACDLAKGMPEAVKMHLDVLDGAPLADVGAGGEVKETAAPATKRPPLNEGERRLTEESLRKVVAACVKLDAELDPATCPRR